MRKQSWVLGVGAVLVLAASGCPKDDAEPAAEQDAGTGAGATEGGWAQIYEQVIVPNGCDSTFCHGSQAELSLSLEDGYENLVGVAAKGEMCAGKTDKQRVVAGEPDSSLLMDKFSDTPSCGDRMPLSPADPATAEQIELVRAWIAAGAKK